MVSDNVIIESTGKHWPIMFSSPMPDSVLEKEGNQPD